GTRASPGSSSPASCRARRIHHRGAGSGHGAGKHRTSAPRRNPHWSTAAPVIRRPAISWTSNRPRRSGRRPEPIDPDTLPRVAKDRELHDDFRRVRPALEGELVRLRPRGQEDLASLNAMFGDPDVLAGLSQVTFPQPLAGIREWFERTRRDDTSVGFVIETLAGEPIGICSLEAIDARSRV